MSQEADIVLWRLPTMAGALGAIAAADRAGKLPGALVVEVKGGALPTGGESWGGAAAALDLFLSALMMHGARRVTVRCSPEYSGLVEGIGKRRRWLDLGLMTVEVRS